MKKPMGMNQDWYCREYRHGRDPYRRALAQQDVAALDRRFHGYLAGVRDACEVDAWVEIVAIGPASIPAMRCPARAGR